MLRMNRGARLAGLHANDNDYIFLKLSTPKKIKSNFNQETHLFY